jgi:uncharacterized protein
MQRESEYSDPIRIRAHHLLCIQGFQGYGYDQDFIQRMGEIIAFLESDPSHKIEIVTESDEICKTCPNLIGKHCINDHYSKIRKLDVHVINHSFLKENSIISFNRAIDAVNNNLKPEDIKIICESCDWINKCLFYKLFF